MFDHSRASSAQAQCGWQVSWVWWHQSGFESVDEGVPIFVNPVLLCVVTVMQNYFLGDVIWAEGTVGWWTCKQMRHRPFWKWKYFIYVPWVLSQLWAPGKCPFSCLRSGIKNEGGSSYSRISLKLRKACSVIPIKTEALCSIIEVVNVPAQNSAEWSQRAIFSSSEDKI